MDIQVRLLSFPWTIYLTGTSFDGSAGTAIVPRSTSHKALLFVDSRYWLQAAQQLDKDEWEVVRVGTGAGSGQASVQSGWIDWIVKVSASPPIVPETRANTALGRRRRQ